MTSVRDGHVYITECIKGTPAAQTYDWRRVVKGARIIEVNEKHIDSIDTLEEIIRQTPKNVNLSFILASSQAHDIHPDTGTPQISFDQFQVIARHHQSAIVDKHIYIAINEAPPLTNTVIHVASNTKPPTKLTRRTLQKRDDWNEWEASEFLQLDQYQKQDMFGPPGTAPVNDNPSR